ncbi:MAG TPA: nicotinate (nicotinamide) nucleotide adenylyltransferase [Flavobacteriaceae bacterium]|nr:nicotinate-nucleotide adenylyltransferase [Flavobacteriaceae bacterium]MCB9212104.1 nicotinate-nucleotide adenylyltransferase [Alteromonas sp.]HPF10516.1 nicotinate (nicotinamide) nucleotide adenylyltransferase [Flavobacteriaceae bacterium]HQU22087.1 nicotinate (nicotinamide) nucleotide adenylyltransferase [Flavobacteriaceae bacterium]HQU66080.1 nicotinate (nicotinamide) nucleotide adenylyltransferase [Flavobacteriaceae bacterium]
MKGPKHIGLYFGTFNPIHIGHLVIANYMTEYTHLEEVWFVVTPHNPHKKKQTLLDDVHRLTLVRIAVEDYPKLKASNVEFDLPQPNYTIHTLAHLEEHYPEVEFALILGEDNLNSFPKWKNHEVILQRHHLYVYPRIAKGSVAPELLNHPHIHRVAAPIMELSATFIRNALKEGKNVRPMLPDPVWRYLDEMHFYR